MLKTVFVLLFSVVNISTSNGIINGDVANIEDHPYIVSVRFNDNHICGGAILNQRIIITSAQCIFDMKPKPKFISIRAGSTQHANGVMIAGKGTPVHPSVLPDKYNREFHENDIGIIKLANDLQWSDKIQPISLPDKNYVVPDDAKATFVGWGITEGKETQVSDTLHKSTVSILSFMNCTMEYGTNMIYPSKMLCGTANQREFCRGDLGGPLVIGDKLIGVASWIYECDTSSYPGVYTNVAHYRDFIDKHLK